MPGWIFGNVNRAGLVTLREADTSANSERAGSELDLARRCGLSSKMPLAGVRGASDAKTRSGFYAGSGSELSDYKCAIACPRVNFTRKLRVNCQDVGALKAQSGAEIHPARAPVHTPKHTIV